MARCHVMLGTLSPWRSRRYTARRINCEIESLRIYLCGGAITYTTCIQKRDAEKKDGNAMEKKLLTYVFTYDPHDRQRTKGENRGQVLPPNSIYSSVHRSLCTVYRTSHNNYRFSTSL